MSLFLVTGPKGHIDSQVLVVEASTVDVAAVGVGNFMGFLADGQVVIADFGDPNSPREYQYVRTVNGQENLVHMNVQPTKILRITGDGGVQR